MKHLVEIPNQMCDLIVPVSFLGLGLIEIPVNEVFHLTILVLPTHIDEMNHVNNVVYLQWVQDAAAAHWNSKASDILRQQYNWVVLRHEIDYKSPALLNDEIIATTWVQDYEGVRSTRIVQLKRKSDGRLLAEAKTNWCLLNATTNRPSRVPEEIKKVFLPSTT